MCRMHTPAPSVLVHLILRLILKESKEQNFHIQKLLIQTPETLFPTSIFQAYHSAKVLLRYLVLMLHGKTA